MSRTIGQIRDILHGTSRWKAGLYWYDFLLAIEFHQDGTGEMMYGENQGLRSDINFRYDITADMQIHFEFFDTIDRKSTPELQSPDHLVCRLLLEKKNTTYIRIS